MKIFRIISVIIGSAALLLYTSIAYIEVNGGGYFCKHCHDPGIYGIKHDAERYLGSYPCKVANDSIHEIKFFWCDPRAKGKFVK